MRVIAGELGGRRLEAPAGTDTRPTSDRAREALFNSLQSRLDLDGAVVADLFAGTGALGIEAWSRGAGHVTFVEQDRRALAAIRHNLSTLGIDESTTHVVAGDADRWRPRVGDRLDVVLADPPYEFAAWSELLDGLPADVVVAESDRPIEVDGWEVVRVRRHGAATITTLVPAAAPEDADRPATDH